MKYNEKSLLPAAIAMMAVLTWICIVVASGYGWNPSKVKWDFDQIAKVGDSFGVVSSAMAAVAAFFAYATFRAQKDESLELKRRAAEPSYLGLVERRYNLLDRVSVTTKTSIYAGKTVEHKGQEAFRYLVREFLRESALKKSDEDLRLLYERIIFRPAYGLISYHRFVFHIIDFAEHHFSGLRKTDKMNKSDPAYFYVKMLRAELSDEEMFLMALNALYGGGWPKLKKFIERYALLNNLNPVLVKAIKLDSKFKDSAFQL